MKFTFLPAVLVSLASLAACQATDVAQSTPTRTIELAGAQSRTTIVVPEDKAPSSDAPFALQGNSSQPVAAPNGTGYQSR